MNQKQSGTMNQSNANTLICTACETPIEAGDRRRPTDSGTAHEACKIVAVSEMIWYGDHGEIDGLAFFKDPELEIPDWLLQAAEKEKLKEGTVGFLAVYADGSLEYFEDDPR